MRVADTPGVTVARPPSEQAKQQEFPKLMHGLVAQRKRTLQNNRYGVDLFITLVD
jgi:hypothetical protein